MPQVVGALLAGLILGPAVLNILHETEFIDMVAELGVIVLMFCAGLETDTKELRKSGKSAFIIAIIGVLVPLAGGFIVAYFFNSPGIIESDAGSSLFLQNMFIGVILTATSVSITVETLKEIGKLKTRSGNAILGAAIIDDVIGIVALTIITSMADSSINVWWVLLKIAVFFVAAGVVGFIVHKLFQMWSDSAGKGLHRHAVIAFALCLLMSFAAEEFFGVADITGAYIAGIIVSNTQRTQFLSSKFDTISYLLLSPVFFASIGLKVILPEMNFQIVMFAVILTIIAVLTKVLGCGLGAKMCGYKNYQSVRIGVGMIARGEVALIVASKGVQVGLLGTNFLGPVVIVVIFTTIITPILLKPLFKKSAEGRPASEEQHNQKGFAHNYEQLSEYRDHDVHHYQDFDFHPPQNKN